jgi:hypothetical protein
MSPSFSLRETGADQSNVDASAAIGQGSEASRRSSRRKPRRYERTGGTTNRRHGFSRGAATPRRQRENLQTRDNVGEKTERERERLDAVPSVSDVGKKNKLVQAQEPRRGSGDGTTPAGALRKKSMGSEESTPGALCETKVRTNLDAGGTSLHTKQNFARRSRNRERAN